MLTAAEVAILVKAKDEASSVLKGFQKTANDVSSGVGHAMGNVLKYGAIAAGAGILGAGAALVSFIGDAQETQKVLAQTDAVLASTQGAAGLTRDNVIDLADSLSRVIPVDDEVIQSTENLLLTFTKIGKDTFPQATETALDMAQALGEDTKSAAIQLGKALQDPINGVTALRRVGVALNDQQLEEIKRLQESGDLLGAQKVILKELQTEFGGSARAAGDTFAGKMKILGTQIDNVKERIGLALLPILTRLVDLAINYVVPALEDGIDAVSHFIDLIAAFASGDGPAAAAAFASLPGPLQQIALFLRDAKDITAEWIAILRSDVLPVFQTVGGAILDNLIMPIHELIGSKGEAAFAIGVIAAAFGVWAVAAGAAAVATIVAAAPVIALILVVGLLSVGIYELVQHWDQIVDALKRGVAWVREHQVALIALAVAVGLLFAPIGFLIALIILVGLHWRELLDITLAVWGAIQDEVMLAVAFLVAVVKFHFESIKNAITTAMNIVRDVIKIVTALIHGDWSEAWDGIQALFTDIWNGILAQLGTHLEFLKAMFSLAGAALYDIAVRIGGGIVKGIWDGLGDLWRLGWDIIDWVLQGIQAAAGGILSYVDDLAGNIADKLNPKNWLGGLGIPGFAGGVVNFTGGMAMVGETGRELMYVPPGASIYSNAQTERMLSGWNDQARAAPAPQVVNQTIYVTIDRNEMHGDPMEAISALARGMA